MGGCGLSVRHSGDTLVLDWRDSRDALPRRCDDAVLLHLQDAFGAWLSETPLWRVEPCAVGRQLCVHDGADERDQYVLDGAGDEGSDWLEYPHQYLDFFSDRGGLCFTGGSALGDF